MVSSFTTNKNIEKPAHNDYVDDWDVPVNGNMNTIDACLGNVTAINMTGLSSYTLTFTDIQATAIRFTGTLGSGPIPIKLANGVSGQFTLIDATTPTDTTSRLNMSWVSGGTALSISQGATRIFSADGGALVWRPAAASATQSMVQILVTGIITTQNFTLDQLSGYVDFVGTYPNAGIQWLAPSTFTGVVTFLGNFTSGGGSSLLFIGNSGGTVQQVNPGHATTIAFVPGVGAQLVAYT